MLKHLSPIQIPFYSVYVTNCKSSNDTFKQEGHDSHYAPVSTWQSAIYIKYKLACVLWANMALKHIKEVFGQILQTWHIIFL